MATSGSASSGLTEECGGSPVTPVALLARRAGYRGLVLPESCATEAAVVREQPIYCVSSLRQLVETLQAGEAFAARAGALVAGPARADDGRRPRRSTRQRAAQARP